MRSLFTLAVVLGAVLPVAGALWLASVLLGRGPVSGVGVLAFSAALNALWPLGGGNGAAGTLRIRLGWREWTVDADRDPWRGRLGAVALAAVTTGGFVVGVPLVALLWRLAPSKSGVDEALALAGVAALILVGGWTWKPELRLSRMVAELERTESEAKAFDVARLSQWVSALARVARPDGSVGHVGGIGALTPGLHEVLDAERLLRSAAVHGVPDAARLHEGCLRYLATQSIPGGGFAAYPGGGGRLALTVRAVEALGSRLPAAERAAHRAFVESCRHPSGMFGRSPGAPPSLDLTRQAERSLSETTTARATGTR